MKTNNQMQKTSLSRRDFLKATGLTAAAFMLPSILASCGETTNPGATSMAAIGSGQTTTDVLVIGGGIKQQLRPAGFCADHLCHF